MKASIGWQILLKSALSNEIDIHVYITTGENLSTFDDGYGEIREYSLRRDKQIIWIY